MDEKSIKEALDNLEQRLKGKAGEEAQAEITKATQKFAEELKGAKESIKTGLKKEFDEEIANLKKEYAEKLEEKQSHLDKIDARIKGIKEGEEESEVMDPRVAYKRYVKAMKAAIEEKAETIGKMAEDSTKVKMSLKDMTLTGNLTGDAVATYQPGVAGIPTQKVNFSDLVPTVQSATGIYVLYREEAPTGVPARQTEAAAKATTDLNLIEVVYNATYLAAFTRFSKQMATDLPFLQSFLPSALRREYFKVENAGFYADVKAAATKATSTGATGIERIVEGIGELENIDYDVNGILLNPVDWAAIANTKPSDFSLPRVVDYVGNQLVVNGIPVFKASFMTAGEYMLADWNMAKKVVVSGLNVQFFEQDSDNVQKNLITARIESRNVLAIDRPDAFMYGNLSGAQPT